MTMEKNSLRDVYLTRGDIDYLRGLLQVQHLTVKEHSEDDMFIADREDLRGEVSRIERIMKALDMDQRDVSQTEEIIKILREEPGLTWFEVSTELKRRGIVPTTGTMSSLYYRNIVRREGNERKYRYFLND